MSNLPSTSTLPLLKLAPKHARTYPLYHITFNFSPAPNHHALFLETAPSASRSSPPVPIATTIISPSLPTTSSTTLPVDPSSPPKLEGYLLHVTGDIASPAGMHFELLTDKNPYRTSSYQGRALLGAVRYGEVGRVVAVCEGVPAPRAEGGGEKEKGRRCGEWVGEVVERLRVEGILV